MMTLENPYDNLVFTHDINAFSNKLLIRNKSDDSSMLSSSSGDDTGDSTEDFIYRLQMHRKSNPANLIAGFLNINSIRNIFSAMQHILCNSYVNSLGVSETKLSDTFPDGQFHVDNYRKDCTSHSGGVALHVRSDIQYEPKTICHRAAESGRPRQSR